MHKRIYNRLAFTFLVLALTSAIFREYADNHTVITEILPNALLMFFTVCLLPVIYPSPSTKNFALRAACLGFGSFIYQLSMYWSNKVFIFASLFSVVLVFSVSLYIYCRIENT